MFQVIDDKKNGKAVWVPVSVRVEDHVVVPDLDHSNIENPDEFIADYTSHLANNPMDMSRPLWEFHVLNIKTSNAESFGIGKFHHSLGDGMSLISLLYASSRKTSDPDAFPTTATTRKHAESKNLWWDTKTPLVGKFGDKVQSRKVIHRIISLDDVKFVKNTMNMKVNDVFLGMTQADDENPMAGNKKQILDKIRLRGTVAVNLRPATKIEVVEAIAKRMFGHTTMTFSNVLGPDEDINFFNHPMCYVAASAMFGPHALIIHYVSYVDKLIINLAVDTAVIPDPHLLCDDLVESLNIIKLAALEKGLHKMEV
ncbi:hypothetical protein DY000_02028989 [Brassica cretica]|uniref:Diacylglycerol O-acyltransferase n=1 Tax=Brassica cretica TaxID=69181 RepID=A0ABQ7DPD4_BRACR|nr:hypothetical protein DY000_02028989 [Brassica cretica]